jgi:predicted Zn-dependent peptidase
MAVFSDWEPAVVDFPDVGPVEEKFNPGVYVIDKDLSQSNIRFGKLGVNMYTPDRFAISIMNYILGGGSFTSRMTSEVRSNLGLALREEDVADHELESAKDAFVNRFIFRFTEPKSIVSRLMNLEYNGMPRDFYEAYLDNVRAVTKEDVLRVANEYLDIENMTFLIVGNSSDFEAPLDELGEVIALELKEPVVD